MKNGISKENSDCKEMIQSQNRKMQKLEIAIDENKGNAIKRYRKWKTETKESQTK